MQINAPVRSLTVVSGPCVRCGGQYTAAVQAARAAGVQVRAFAVRYDETGAVGLVGELPVTFPERDRYGAATPIRAKHSALVGF